MVHIMKRKFIVLILIVMVAFIGLSAASAANENDASNKTKMSIEAQHPLTVSKLVHLIQSQPYYRSYDYSVLKWLKGLDSNDVVFSGNGYFIIMNSTDANKLSKNANTGVSTTCNISCSVLENKSLGKNLDNIVLVDNVELSSKGLNNFNFN